MPCSRGRSAALAPTLPGQEHQGLRAGRGPLRSRLPYWGFRTDAIAGRRARESGRPCDTTRQALSKRDFPWRANRKKERDALRAARAGGEAPITTAWVAHELNELLPRDAVLVNETITHRLDLLSLVDRLGPGGFYEASFGGLGVGLGVALGVKHAEPARTVVCTIGDGAFHYNPVPASFGAAQEHGLPIFVILFNNAGYLSQKADVAKYYPQGQAVKTGRFAGTSISPAPDYAALARVRRRRREGSGSGRGARRCSAASTRSRKVGLR